MEEEEEYGDENDYIPFGAFFLNKLPIYAEYANLFESLPKWMMDKYVTPDYGIVDWATSNNITTDANTADAPILAAKAARRASVFFTE